MRRPATIFEAGTVAGRSRHYWSCRWGRAAIAGRDAVGTKGGFALILVAAVAKAEHLLTVVRLGATPGAATIFPKHPHIEGRPPSYLTWSVHRLPRPRARANVCQPRARAMLPAAEVSTAIQEALLQQPSAYNQSPPGPEAGSSSTKKRGSWSQLPAGFCNQTTNSGDTSAEWKRGRGGRATIARLPSSTGPP